MQYQLGKLPAEEPRLCLTSYIPTTELPEAPPSFGWDYLIPADGWGMLANADHGCCVFSGAGHEHMLLAKSGGHTVTFADSNILGAYHDVTGFNPADPSTDQGTSVAKAMEWRRTVGLQDTAGNRHRLAAYAGLEAYGTTVNLDQLASVAWLFGAAGIGIAMPQYAMDQAQTGEPWDVAYDNAEIVGGHYVPLVGRKDGMWHAVTWGKIQPVTDRFLLKYCDEAWAVLSTEQFSNGLNLDGLRQDAWLADIEAIPGAVVTPDNDVPAAAKRARKRAAPQVSTGEQIV